MWRRVLVAMGLAGAALVALLLLFLRSERGGRDLCALAEATLREVSGERVTIARCRVDPLGTRVFVEGVEIGDPDRPLMAVESLTAGLAVRGLLEGRVRVDGVKLVRPRVFLDLSQPQPADDPRTRPDRTSSAHCLPDPGALELGRLDLQGGEVTVALPDGRSLSAHGVEISVRGRESLIEAGLSTARTVFDDAGEALVVERLQLRGRVDLETGYASLENLDVSAQEGSLFAAAEFTSVCEGTGRATANVHLDLSRVSSTLLSQVPGLTGQASLKLSARMNKGDWSLETSGQLMSAGAWGLGPADLDLSVAVQPGLLTLQRLELPLPSGRMEASGTLTLALPYQAQVEAKLERVVLGELLERLGVPDLTVHAQASGMARLEGPLVTARGPRLAGQVDWHVEDFGVFDDIWRRRATAENRWVGFGRGRLQSGVVLARDRLLLSDARITTGHSEVHTDGTVYFDVPRGLDLKVNATALRLEEIGPFGPTPIRGQGVLEGTVEGPYTGLIIKATSTMNGVDVMGLDLGRMSATAHMDLARGTLAVPHMEGLKGRSAYSGDGAMWFTPGAPMVARLDLPGAWLGDVATVARGMVPVLGSLDGNLDARLIGELTASGPAARLDVDGTLALSDITAWGQRFERGWVEASMVDGSRLEVRSLDLERGEGRVQASATLAFASGAFTALVNTRRLEAGSLDMLATGWPGLTGGVELELNASGTLKQPRGRAALTLTDWWMGDQPLASARLSARAFGQRVVVDGLVESPWAPGTQVARGEDGVRPSPPGSMRHVLRGDLRLDDGQSWTATASFDVPDASRLLPAGSLGDLFASARGTLTGQGRLSQPSATKAQLSLSEVRVEKGRARFVNSAPGLADLENGRFVLHQLPLRGSGMDLDAHGAREADGRLAFEVGGTAELDLLEELVPGLDDVRGNAELALQVGGTLQAPLVLGEARIDRLRLVPEGGLVTITEGTGSVAFSPEAMSLNAFSGRLNGGDFDASGRVSLDQFKPRDVDLTATMEEVPLRVSDVSMRLSGTSTLRGALDDLRLAGEVEVTWLRFNTDLELERTIVQALELSRRPPAPKVFERRGEFLSLDLGVHLGDVRVENNLVQTGLAGDLRLVGTNRRPSVLGAVTLTDGRAFVRNVEYRLTSGVVNFTDPARIRPAFDVRADASVRDYLVRVSASGTAQQPRLHLTSDPALPYADIVTLLTLGVTSRDLERTGGASGVALLLDAAYNAGFLGINDQVKRLLPQNQILRGSSFRVTSAYSELTGNVEPVAQFETTFLTDDMKLRGQTSLMGSRGSRAQVEYELDEGMSVQGQIDSNDPNTPSGVDLGADFIFKREWP